MVNRKFIGHYIVGSVSGSVSALNQIVYRQYIGTVSKHLALYVSDASALYRVVLKCIGTKPDCVSALYRVVYRHYIGTTSHTISALYRKRIGHYIDPHPI